jgi:hypothetical protein
MPARRRSTSSRQRLKKAQLSFYPEIAEYEALRELSARTKVPQQVYLREGLRYVLQQMDVRARRSAAPARRSELDMEAYTAFAAELQEVMRRTTAALGRYRTEISSRSRSSRRRSPAR